MKGIYGLALALGLGIAAPAALAQQGPVQIFGLVELSGTGTTSGTNFDNGVKLAVKEINASGGILGRKIEYTSLDTQSQPQVAKALAQKAIDQGAYVVMGPVFSGSILVSMAETKRAEVPNFTGGEAAAITQQGNPYIFRTSFTQTTAMPKVARYLKDTVKAKTVAIIWVNNDFGKGGRDTMRKALEAQGIKVAADISTDPGQLDFSGAVLKAKQSNADALFVYTNEEESARALRELRKQGYDKPIVGETVADQPEGDRARRRCRQRRDGARRADRRCAAADDQGVQRRLPEGIQLQVRPQRPQGLQRRCTSSRRSPRRSASSTRRRSPRRCTASSLSAKEYPGVLLDVSFDDNGDLDRESFMTTVVNGKQVVTATLPAASAK